ncbi:zf-UBP-domain-containing protein, partial [Nadsonia fulvescens var. elongata DSM 6958]
RFGHITVQGFDSNSNSSDTSENMNIRARYMGEGVIRLYRSWETSETESNGDGIHPGEDGSKNCKTNMVNRSSDGTMLAILAVPSYLTSSDFYGFIGQNARDNVSHFRFLHNYDHSRNRYMALLKFRSSESASEFMAEYNGKQFNSFESENCHVLQVSQIYYNMMLSEVVEPGDAGNITSTNLTSDNDDEIPYLLDDPFITRPRARRVGDKNNTNNTSNTNNNPHSPRPLPPPTPALSELPTCPVCLERMDAATTGLMTIRCQHTFHCSCLSKWHDGSCPVCRYVQPLTTPRLTQAAHSHYNVQESPENELDLVNRDRSVPLCSTCGSLNNLWVCLVCGNIGCSRYNDAHAFDHYKRTNHIFSMDLATQRVWDYISDGYVHRLIQNSIDGKVVEVEDGMSQGIVNGNYDFYEDDSNDIAMQFTYLLASQLDNQREYYEARLAQAADKYQVVTNENGQQSLELQKLREEIQQLRLDNQELGYSIKHLNKLQDKFTKLSNNYSVLHNQHQDEKRLNERVVEKLKLVTHEMDVQKTEKAKLKEKVNDLSDQLRDLMISLDFQGQLQHATEEVQMGTVVVAEAPGGSGGSSHAKRGKKTKK